MNAFELGYAVGHMRKEARKVDMLAKLIERVAASRKPNITIGKDIMTKTDALRKFKNLFDELDPMKLAPAGMRAKVTPLPTKHPDADYLAYALKFNRNRGGIDSMRGDRPLMSMIKAFRKFAPHESSGPVMTLRRASEMHPSTAAWQSGFDAQKKLIKAIPEKYYVPVVEADAGLPWWKRLF
jgi:hypothetical protein